MSFFVDVSHLILQFIKSQSFNGMLESVCGLLSFFSFDTSGISSISEFLQIYCKRSVWQWEKKLPAMPIIVILWCGTWGHWELEIHARKKKKKSFSRLLCFFHNCIHISNSSYGSVVCYLKKEIRFTLGLFWLLDIKQGYRRFFLFA